MVLADHVITKAKNDIKINDLSIKKISNYMLEISTIVIDDSQSKIEFFLVSNNLRFRKTHNIKTDKIYFFIYL